jgi:4-amino-4-deoxy-L-arabinose transferase-like glycosyltransferase
LPVVLDCVQTSEPVSRNLRGRRDWSKSFNTPHARLEWPDRAIIAFCAVQLFAWTLIPALTRSALPRNAIEGYAWGREWLLISWKHPQLPAWCLEASRLLTGTVGWPAFLLPQLFVVATYVLVFTLGKDLFGRDIVGREHSAAGTALLVGISFFTWPSVQFDHNVAQMPFWAATCLLAWRSVERDDALSWIAFGIVAGFGFYAKLSNGLLLAFIGCWFVWDVKARGKLRARGPWLAATLCLVTAGPLAAALWASGFEPLKYASAESSSLHNSPLSFLLREVGDNALFLVAVAFLATRNVSTTYDRLEDRKRRFLWLLGLGPLVLVTLASIRGGIIAGWAAPMYNLVGLIAVDALRSRLDASIARRLMLVSGAAVLAMACLDPLILEGERYFETSPRLALWPEAEIASRFEALWHQKVGTPLLIVGGDPFVAGVIAVPLLGAKVFPELDPEHAPWIKRAKIAGHGLLVVWQGEHPPSRWSADATAIAGTELFSWSPTPWAKPIIIHYEIVPPRPGLSREGP